MKLSAHLRTNMHGTQTPKAVSDVVNGLLLSGTLRYPRTEITQSGNV